MEFVAALAVLGVFGFVAFDVWHERKVDRRFRAMFKKRDDDH